MSWKRIRSHRERITAFFLVLVMSLTQLISTYALDDVECHVIKYTQDWLLQTLENAKNENKFFNADLVKLPFENDELKKTIVAEGEGMLLLDTVVEDDGCTAYVAMNPDSYEIAIFTVNFTDEKHNFKIDIQATEVSETTVDVYSKETVTEVTAEKPKEEAPAAPNPSEVNAGTGGEAEPVTPETPGNAEVDPAEKPTPDPVTGETTQPGGESANTGTDPQQAGDSAAEKDKNQEPEQTNGSSEPSKTDTTETGTSEPQKTENAETSADSDKKDSSAENKQENTENEVQPNVFDAIDNMVKDSENDSVVLTTSRVMNPAEESESQPAADQTSADSDADGSSGSGQSSETPAPAPETKDDSNSVPNSQDGNASEAGDTGTTPPTDSGTDATSGDETDKAADQTSEEPKPSDAAATEPAETVTEKLVTETLDIGDIGMAEIEIPSGGLGVFKTLLVLSVDNVTYLPAHLYDYNDGVRFGYADYYVGAYNGVVHGIGESQLRRQTTDGYYYFNSIYGVNPFPQQYTSGRGVNMKNYYSCEFPFLVDSNGYYEYDSDKRGAKLVGESGDYRVELLRSTGPNFGRRLDTDGRTYGFFPFNSQGDSNPNYYFGLNLSVSFTMPKDGKVNNKDMTFEFSGDDDMWVYIDGKLALDLGGIHDAMRGSINFSTGEIVHEKVYNAPRGVNRPVIWNLYDSKNYVSGSQKNVGIQKDNYMQHTLQIFYMERGAGGSNCKMRFNIQPIPKNSVSITKDASGVNSAITNEDFEFMIKTKNSYSDSFTAKQLDYTVDGVKRSTDANGRFTLRDGQTAYFEGITYVNVVETLSPNYNQAWKMAGSDLTFSSNDTGQIYTDSGSTSIVFLNQYKYTNLTGNLKISKNLSKGSPDDTEFGFYVAMNGVPYNGSAEVYTGTETTTCSVNNGILKLKANQYALIKGIPFGTAYEAYELLNDDYSLKAITHNGRAQSVTAHVTGRVSVRCINPVIAFTNEKKLIPLGSITVKNIIRDNWEAHGDPIFVYRLETIENGTLVGTIYDYIRYEDGETAQKQLVFENLPLGYTYRVVQEKALRYTLVSAYPDTASQGGYNDAYQSVEFDLTESNKDVGATFVNTKDRDLWFSHTDAARNSFTIG